MDADLILPSAMVPASRAHTFSLRCMWFSPWYWPRLWQGHCAKQGIYIRGREHCHVLLMKASHWLSFPPERGTNPSQGNIHHPVLVCYQSSPLPQMCFSVKAPAQGVPFVLVDKVVERNNRGGSKSIVKLHNLLNSFCIWFPRETALQLTLLAGVVCEP